MADPCTWPSEPATTCLPSVPCLLLSRCWSSVQAAEFGLEDQLTGAHSRHRRMVDVGGGLGGQLCAILRQHPGLTGTLFDRPATLERACEVLDPEVAPRITLTGGDFFSAVADGATHTCSRRSFTTGTTMQPRGSWRASALRSRRADAYCS